VAPASPGTQEVPARNTLTSPAVWAPALRHSPDRGHRSRRARAQRLPAIGPSLPEPPRSKTLKGFKTGDSPKIKPLPAEPRQTQCTASALPLPPGTPVSGGCLVSQHRAGDWLRLVGGVERLCPGHLLTRPEARHVPGHCHNTLRRGAKNKRRQKISKEIAVPAGPARGEPPPPHAREERGSLGFMKMMRFSLLSRDLVTDHPGVRCVGGLFSTHQTPRPPHAARDGLCSSPGPSRPGAAGPRAQPRFAVEGWFWPARC